MRSGPFVQFLIDRSSLDGSERITIRRRGSSLGATVEIGVMTWVPLDPNRAHDPDPTIICSRIESEDYGSMLDGLSRSLANAGIRTGIQPEEIKRLEAHLDDMRALVFKADKPE